MQEFLVSMLSVVVMVVFAVLGWGVTWLKGKYEDKEIFGEAIEALQIGVDQAHEEFVRLAKLAAADGKLTGDERVQAVNIAIKYAKGAVFGKPAHDLIVNWGRLKLDSYIKELLANRGKKTTVVINREVEADKGRLAHRIPKPLEGGDVDVKSTADPVN